MYALIFKRWISNFIHNIFTTIIQPISFFSRCTFNFSNISFLPFFLSLTSSMNLHRATITLVPSHHCAATSFSKSVHDCCHKQKSLSLPTSQDAPPRCPRVRPSNMEVHLTHALSFCLPNRIPYSHECVTHASEDDFMCFHIVFSSPSTSSS